MKMMGWYIAAFLLGILCTNYYLDNVHPYMGCTELSSIAPTNTWMDALPNGSCNVEDRRHE